MTDDEPMFGSGNPLPNRATLPAERKQDLPEHVGALEALGIHLRDIEKEARRNGPEFWERERTSPFEATNLAFLLRSMRSLLLILSTEAFLLEELRQQALGAQAG